MAPPSPEDHGVTRTYRTTVRFGEGDYVTLEETVSLPLDASDEDIQQAVALGWRIYQAQHEALESQVASIRETRSPAGPITIRNPDAPASDSQRKFIARLQADLGWNDDRMAAFASEQGLRLVDLTKGQASSFIDELKQRADEAASYQQTGARHGAGAAVSEPASASYEARQGQGDGTSTEHQQRALRKLAQARSIDLAAVLHEHYGVATVEALTDQQAGSLIQEWQRTPRPQSPDAETP